MIVYNYNAKGVYVGPSEARKDPLESTVENPVFLIPANATTKEPPFKDGYTGVFKNNEWSLIEDHRGEKAFTDLGEQVVVEEVGSLSNLKLSKSYTPPDPSPQEKRDRSLAELVHDFGDGRIIQCRPHPFSDESNMRNAIEQMNRLGQSERLWFAADNTGVMVSPADLQAAIESGQDQSALVWQQFFTEIGG